MRRFFAQLPYGRLSHWGCPDRRSDLKRRLAVPSRDLIVTTGRYETRMNGKPAVRHYVELKVRSHHLLLSTNNKAYIPQEKIIPWGVHKRRTLTHSRRAYAPLRHFTLPQEWHQIFSSVFMHLFFPRWRPLRFLIHLVFLMLLES